MASAIMIDEQTIESESNISDYYTPGVCNINKPEVEYRRKFGRIFTVISAVIVAALLALNALPILSILVTFPAFISAISYLQSKNSFCVAYAAQGKFNDSDEYAKTTEVTNKADMAKDKAKSTKMYRQASLFSVAVTFVLYAVLSLF